ncbi:K+ channel tetramerisation domain protein [Ancylostoma ceylanicum]|uniref:K+ channel tetramerisation domain protein n=1 Tax=Ancylostoma ceylanicum TaxID=53326 RepID=A0A0D6LFC9_9BILA|nr:K+ channel tetramerisation domain protein [Ancylostoma ceylanicum]
MVFPSMTPIKLNVGGHNFETTVGTLKGSTRLAEMAREAEELLIDRKHEAIFIDRDPRYFPDILKYLREGKLRFSACGREIEGIREDAEYYGIEALAEKLRIEEAHRGPFFVGERVIKGFNVKVYGDSCCYDVTFGNWPEVFHVLGNMLRLETERKGGGEK